MLALAVLKACFHLIEVLVKKLGNGKNGQTRAFGSRPGREDPDVQLDGEFGIKISDLHRIIVKEDPNTGVKMIYGPRNFEASMDKLEKAIYKQASNTEKQTAVLGALELQVQTLAGAIQSQDYRGG